MVNDAPGDPGNGNSKIISAPLANESRQPKPDVAGSGVVAPDGPDDAFTENVGGGCSDRCFEGAGSEISQSEIDRSGENGITVMDHDSIRMVVCKKFAELLNGPFGG